MYLVVVCNCCLQYLLLFCMLNIHGMYNVWLCVVYEILLCSLAPSVTNLRDIITRNVWKVCEFSTAIDLSILVMKRCLLSQQAISLGTVMSVWDIHV